MPQGISEDLFAWDVASGPLGSIDAIPAGFSLTYVLSFGDSGINNAMRRWGDVLLVAHAKQRGGAERSEHAPGGHITLECVAVVEAVLDPP